MKAENILNLFIIDDDPVLRATLKKEIERNFHNENIRVNCFESGEAVKSRLQEEPDIAIVDYQLGSTLTENMNGMELIELIKEKTNDTEIILFTAHENTGLAIEAFERGAHDYVVKNKHMFDRLKVALLRCIKLHELKLELKRQKLRGTLALIFIGFLLMVVTLIQVFAPHLLKT